MANLDDCLPIKWDCLKPSALHELLSHSDCDGEIAADRCGPIADALESLIPLLPDEDGNGHIGNWRTKRNSSWKGCVQLHRQASRWIFIDLVNAWHLLPDEQFRFFKGCNR
jgi:hypothetical protein